MGTQLTTIEGSARAITYATTVTEIMVLAKQYKGIDARANFETARAARQHLRTLRVGIEARRKELKAEALEFGRQVDGGAKVLREAIEAIENPIDAQIKAIEQEEAKAKFEIENAERLAREQKEREEREAEEKKKADALEEERQKLAEQQRQQEIERDRLAQEAAALEVKQRRENARLEKERQALADREKAVKDAEDKVKADKEEAERAEQERVAAEQAEAKRVADKAAALAKAAALKPDKEKLAAFATRIRAVWSYAPSITGDEAGEALDRAQADVEDIAKRLEAFGS